MSNVLRRLVVDEEPLEILRAVWLRRTTWLVVFIATGATLFIGTIEHALELGDPLTAAIGVPFVTAMNLTYLYLIFWYLILSCPPSKLYKQRIIFPLLLMLAYIVYAVSAYFSYSTIPRGTDGFGISIQSAKLLGLGLRLTGHGALIIFYFLWLLRDVFEWQSANLARKASLVLWVVLEVVSILALGGRLTFDLTHKALFLKPPLYFDKDAVILGTLVIWLLVSLILWLFKRSQFPDQYSNYLQHNIVDRIEPDKLASFPWGNVKNVLDFGCGNGSRLIEVITWLGRNDLKGLVVHGYDSNKDWEARFLSTVEKAYPEQKAFYSTLDSLRSRTYDLIILSHVLYWPAAVRDAVHLLRSCGSATKVLVRGTSPNSFFHIVSLAQAWRPFRPNISYRWEEWAMRQLVSEANLVPLFPNKSPDTPDGRFHQRYVLTEVSIDAAARLLDSIYGGNAQDFIRDLSSALRVRGNVQHLANEDVVFLFTRQT